MNLIKFLNFLGLKYKENQNRNIKLDSLINTLGYSIYSAEFKNIIKELNCTELDKYWDVRNKDEAFRISFHHKSDHQNRIGIPKGLVTFKDDEPIVYLIIFQDLDLFEKKTPNLQLPYLLKVNDSKEEVFKKIGNKSYESYKVNPPGKTNCFYEFFDCDNIQIEAYYENNSLIKLMFSKFTLEERSKIEFEKEIREQRKNINPKFYDNVILMTNELPDLTFGDNNRIEFAKNINKELVEFTENCAKYTKSKNPKAIINSVKKVIEKINIVNVNSNIPIETIEREAICEFIDEVLKTTGLKNIDDIDITEDWREW